MPKKVTTEEFIERARAVHGDRYDYSLVEYVNNSTKVKIICKKHGAFEQRPANHMIRDGCPKCGRDMVKNKLKFAKKIEDINSLLIQNKIDFQFYTGQIYKNNCTKLLGVCPRCGDSKTTLANLLRNNSSGCCSGQRIATKNTVAFLRPDLVPFFKNPTDAERVTLKSGKRIDFKCIKCGYEKIMPVSNFMNQGFCCDLCSNKHSLPERFIRSVIKELSLQYEPHKTFNWSNRKQYDFYIPSLNMIIEAHGIQHYEQSNRGRSLKEEQENDILKKKIAKENGIEHYVSIDCRYSSFEWLTKNIEKSLNKYISLDINYKKIWENIYEEDVLLYWEAWNNRGENDTTTSIAKHFSINVQLLVKYLKIGADIERCNYNPKEESSKIKLKNFQKNRGDNSRKVNQYIDNEFIKGFKSLTDGSVSSGDSISAICHSCRKKNKTAGGFIWRYADDLEGIAELERLRTENENKLLTTEVEDDII